MTEAQTVAGIAGVKAVIDTMALAGIKVDLTGSQIVLVGEGLMLLINLASNSALKHAAAAGQAGADSVKTVADANSILEALAANERTR
jgi:hypothetical protein